MLRSVSSVSADQRAVFLCCEQYRAPALGIRFPLVEARYEFAEFAFIVASHLPRDGSARACPKVAEGEVDHRASGAAVPAGGLWRNDPSRRSTGVSISINIESKTAGKARINSTMARTIALAAVSGGTAAVWM